MRTTPRRKQRGFWSAVAAIGAGLIAADAQEGTNESNQGINSAGNAFNAEEARKQREFDQYEAAVARDWQNQMRATQYQTAVGDMKAAGLNPMLAYQQGGAGTPTGATARGSAAHATQPIPMQNSTLAGLNAAMAAAQIKNVQSQTTVNEKTAEKVEAETPQVIASTGQIKQQTENLKAEMFNIKERMGEIIAHKDLLIKQGYTQTDLGNLYKAQEELSRVDKMLKTEQITFTEAQTKLNRALTTLRQLEFAGAKNESDFETKMGEGVGVGGKQVSDLVNILRKALGK